MLWVVFSVLAALAWAAANLIDKFTMTKWTKNPFLPILVQGFIVFALIPVIFVFNGFSFLSYQNIFLAFTAGILYGVANFAYFEVLRSEEVSKVIPLLYLDTVFLLFFASFFLSEYFTFEKYLGVFLLVSGAILISLGDIKKVNFGKALILIIFGAVLYALHSVIIKYLLGFADVWTVFSYSKAGMLLVLIPVCWKFFPELISMVKEHGKKSVFVMGVSEFLGVLGYCLLVFAFSLGPVTLVNALASVQPFFVLLFTVLFSLFFPRILSEGLNRQAIMLKLIAMIFMFAGAVLVI